MATIAKKRRIEGRRWRRQVIGRRAEKDEESKKERKERGGKGEWEERKCWMKRGTKRHRVRLS